MSDSECSPPTTKRSRQEESADLSPSEDLNERHVSNDPNMPTIPTSQPSAIEEVLANAREAVLMVTEAIDETSKMRDDAHLAINQAFETLHQELELRKEALLSKLKSMFLSKSSVLTLQKERLEKLVAAILTNNDETAALGVLIEAEVLKNVEPISLVSNMHSDIHVVLPTHNLTRELSTFGYISDLLPSPSSSTWTSTSVAKVRSGFLLKVESKTSKGTLYKHGGLQMKAEMRCNNGAVVHGKAIDHGDGTYTTTLIPQTTGPHQLLITMNGQQVKNSPHDLKVLPQYVLVKKQVIKCPKAPSGIAIHENGDLYVATAEDCIYVFDKTGHRKITQFNDGLIFQRNNIETWNSSASSSLTIMNNQLYVAGIGKKCIELLNLDGTSIKKFSDNEATGILFDDEYFAIFVSDCKENKIIALNHHGGTISTIDGIKSPYGLALDPLGNIHIAASGSNTIKVFTKEGVYIRKYGNLKDPRGIAIDGGGYSFVTEYKGKCISIFNPEGIKIHTMAVRGNPFGLVLDSKTNSLYVSLHSVDLVLKYSI